MNFLVYSTQNDARLKWLTETLHSSAQVGYCSTIVEDDIKNFRPDVIIHDSIINPLPQIVGINFSSLNLNGLEPFVRLSSDDLSGNEYSYDVSYYGDISQGTPLNKAICSLSNHIDSLAVFHSKPFFVSFYRGDLMNIRKLYNQSKVSISDSDKYRLYDIIYSQGNPVVFNGETTDEFKDAVMESIKGKKYDGVTRKEILAKHTNYDRMSDALKEIGMKTFASSIKKKKESFK